MQDPPWYGDDSNDGNNNTTSKLPGYILSKADGVATTIAQMSVWCLSQGIDAIHVLIAGKISLSLS